jgi:hypothetical protein
VNTSETAARSAAELEIFVGWCGHAAMWARPQLVGYGATHDQQPELRSTQS